jgi:hypothetical protein
MVSSIFLFARSTVLNKYPRVVLVPGVTENRYLAYAEHRGWLCEGRSLGSTGKILCPTHLGGATGVAVEVVTAAAAAPAAIDIRVATI